MRTSHCPLYPVFLDLSGSPVLVIGGGEVALRKVATLLECGAKVTLIAPEIHVELAKLLKRHRKSVRVQRRRFGTKDLSGGFRLVFAATHNHEQNAAIATACRKKGIWVNVAAPPEAGDAQIPAAIRHGQFCVAFSTGGASAALARTVRGHMEKQVGPEWGVLAEILSARREKIQKGVPDPERRSRLLQQLGHIRWVRLVKRTGRRKVEQLIDRHISEQIAEHMNER